MLSIKILNIQIWLMRYQYQQMMMDQQKTMEHPTQIQGLKNLLTEILHNNTAYDCMPINSSINSIDKSMSLYDAINMLISKQLQQLLVWDEDKSKWIWMLTLVDAIRFITHALKSLLRCGYVDFSDFQKQKQEMEGGVMVSKIVQCSKDQLNQVIQRLQQKTLQQIIKQITLNSPVKSYIRLKSVQKQAKISLVILMMSVQKIHRILIQDTESHMIISVLNFKDIFLYIMGIANESPTTYNYSTIGIHSILSSGENKNIQIQQSRPLWQAFQIMTDRDKSLWINVVDSERKFKGMLFREDFRGIFKGWHVQYMWLSVGEFIQWKKASDTMPNIPQYRFFQPTETTRDILWKMIMSRRNTIVCVNDKNELIATIGLMQVFRLYLS